MNNLSPFFLAGCGALFSVLGAWGLLTSLRTGGEAGPAAGPTSDPGAVKDRVRAILVMNRISGLFWFCLGVATLWYSDIRHSWSRPDSWIWASVGLFWAVGGVGATLSSFRRGRRDAIARHLATAGPRSATSNANARGRARWACALFLCSGIAMVAFSGIRVGWSPAVATQPSRGNNRLAEVVTRHVERAFERKAHVGLVVGAIAGGEEILLGFGARQVGDSRPPDPDTVFEIGSLTKAFTGILLAQRIEDGGLELDDRIAELLPEGWSLSESARGITLRHCTTQTSGFPRLPANLIGVSGVFRMLSGGDPYRAYSENDFRAALATVELESDPGTKYGYSNFAVGLLGFVLATQNGSDYETLVTSRICRPLGMQRTVLTQDQWHREHLPSKYRATLGPGPVILALESDEWRIPNHLAGAGAIRSTGRDVMTFLKANMGLIPTPIDGAIRRSHQELFRDRADQAMGMNWIRSFKPAIAQEIIWHNGGTGGFSTYLGFTEDRRSGVFVLSNTGDSVDAVAEAILEALARGYGPGARRPATRPSLRLRVRPIEDKEPETTEVLRGVLVAMLGGPLDPDLFTRDAQRARFPAKVDEVGKKIARIGPLASFELIGRKDERGWRTHRYRAVLGERALVVTFALAIDGKIGGLTVVPE